MTAHNPSSPGFFEQLYQANPDPWNFAGDAYEQSRYDAIIAALSHRRYREGFEGGCSIGVLTERLAAHCDHLTAVDFSPSAIARARQRCAHLPNVNLVCASLDECLPLADADLIVLSEIGYYYTPEAWATTLEGIVAPLRSGSTVLAAHWLGSSADHTGKGDQVHDILRSNTHLRLEHEQRFEGFRLDRLVRR